MPDPDVQDSTKTVILPDVAKAVIEQVLEPAVASKIGQFVQQNLIELIKQVLGVVLFAAGEIGATVARGVAGAEDESQGAFGDLASAAVEDLFGVQVSPATMGKRGDRAARTQVANQVGDMLFKAFAGNAAGLSGGELQPTDAPAKAFLSTMTQLALEGWLEGFIVELCSLGQIESFGELDDTISHILGLGRASASVHGPLVKHLVVTPLEWKLLREHRPTLLTPSSAARQIARGFGDKERWLEDIRRAGYSDQRIEALLNEQRHYFGAGDVRTFVEREYWTKDQGLQHLRDQGYDEQSATDALRLEGLRRIEQLEQQEATAIIAAYVSGDIDHGAFTSALGVAVRNETERNLLSELADVRKAMNVKRLTAPQVASMVEDGILAYVDYRRALERDGYEDAAVTVLELQLRKKIDDKKTIAQHREDLEAARAAEKAARAAAAAARRAEIEAERALKRRGQRADLERAAVRGLIPLDRVAEVYAAQFDADTAAVYMALLEDERQAYVDQQQARADAAKRAAQRGIDVGALDAAVMAGTLTLDDFRRRLADLKFSPADADLLTATLAARVQDRDDAKAARDEAAAAAKIKHVSLNTIETLVRRGHRSLADYDRALQDLGFDDGARAAMRELLQDQIDEDAQARAEREAAAAKRDAKGLSLEQIRRAVILGLQTIDDFQRYLTANNYTPDAMIVLTDELRADVAEADAARQRRADADAATDTRDAPLSDVARAARLGLVPVQAYADRLTHAGFTPDAIDLEVDLLVEEMAAAADARAQRQAAEEASSNRGLPLSDVARAVKAGLRSLDDYVAAARDAGLSDAAAATLGQLLDDELQAAAAADARRAAIAAAAGARHLSLGQLEAAVKAGITSLDEFAAAVGAMGYGAEDAALLVMLLARELAIIPDAQARRAALGAQPTTARASLSDLETGVKQGVITMATYLDELRSRGYGPGDGLEVDQDGRLVLAAGADEPLDDTALLGLLLQVQLDAIAAKGAA